MFGSLSKRSTQFRMKFTTPCSKSASTNTTPARSQLTSHSPRAHLRAAGGSNVSDGVACGLIVYHESLKRNKRCLLTYL
jgi:hypothetical protein